MRQWRNLTALIRCQRGHRLSREADQRLSTMATHDETEDGEIEPAELDERAEEVEDGEFLTFEEFAGKRE